jgi:hypothetical protein
VAALPLPVLRDTSAIVKGGLAKAMVRPAAIGGAAVMAATVNKTVVVALVAAALGVGLTLVVQSRSAREGRVSEAAPPPGVVADEIAKRDAEIASLRKQLVEAGRRRDAERREGANPPDTQHATDVAKTAAPALPGLDAISWDRVSAALLRSAKAVRSHESPDAEALGELFKLLQQLESMKDQLGGGSGNELLAHPEVEARLLGAIAKTLAPELTDKERESLQDEVRSAVVAAARDRPRDVAPLLRVDHDLSTSDRIRGILARHVGARLADSTEGLTFGVPGNPAYGRSYIVAATRADIVKAIMSYWTEAVKLDDSQSHAAERIAAEWAEAVLAIRERAVREFGEETARAAFTEAPKVASTDPLGATRRDPAFSARHRTIVEWVRTAQAKFEDEFFQTLSNEQRKEYEQEIPEVLLFSASG